MRTVAVFQAGFVTTTVGFPFYCCSDGFISDLRHYVTFSKVPKCKSGDATQANFKALENLSINRVS